MKKAFLERDLVDLIEGKSKYLLLVDQNEHQYMYETHYIVVLKDIDNKFYRFEYVKKHSGLLIFYNSDGTCEEVEPVEIRRTEWIVKK